jgi:hypothetical protein
MALPCASVAGEHLSHGGALEFENCKKAKDDEMVLSSFQARRFHFSLAGTVEDN